MLHAKGQSNPYISKSWKIRYYVIRVTTAPQQYITSQPIILCSRSACDTFTIIIFYCRRCVILMLNVEHVTKFPQVIPQYDGLVTMLMYRPSLDNVELLSYSIEML